MVLNVSETSSIDMNCPPQTDRIASRPPIGSRRWSIKLPHTTTSNVPSFSGESS
jgi:hypothetical protein